MNQSHLQKKLAINHQASNIPRIAMACNGTANLEGRKNPGEPITQVQEERRNKVGRKVAIADERIFISQSFSFPSSASF